MAKTKELVKSNGNGNEIIPFDSVPEYLPATSKGSGMESMGKDDYKTPRIILLQGLSPELKMFSDTAKMDNFWHTGMNMPLGKEFIFTPIIANKRVILWRPRNDQNGGILAFSKNGKTWDSGANQTFKVMLKNKNEPVTWKTGKDVLSSKLTQFGTSDPENPQSAPAASVIYEYLVYLKDHPELSPCVMSVSKTALPNGRNFNTSLAMKVRQGKSINSIAVRCFVEDMSKGKDNWSVPNFEPIGWAPEYIFATTTKIAESYAEYETTYEQESDSGVQDEIPF